MSQVQQPEPLQESVEFSLMTRICSILLQQKLLLNLSSFAGLTAKCCLGLSEALVQSQSLAAHAASAQQPPIFVLGQASSHSVLPGAGGVRSGAFRVAGHWDTVSSLSAPLQAPASSVED